MKVYAVVWEDYEEHHVHEGRVYTSKAAAEELKAALNAEVLEEDYVKRIRATVNPKWEPSGGYHIEEYDVL